MSSIGVCLIGFHYTFSCLKTRLSCCDGFFFTVGSRQGDSILRDYVLWSCYSRHDCDWTTVGHYKSILVILDDGGERGEERGGRRRREEKEGGKGGNERGKWEGRKGGKGGNEKGKWEGRMSREEGWEREIGEN